MMAITALYAAPLAALFIWLSFRVIARRRSALVPYGPGEDRDLLQRMRIHANFAEYTPFALIVMMLAESLSAPHLLLHLIGLLLLAGRFIHGIGLSQNPNKIKL
ncbi:MAG: MAPEG family protein, partial [Alphaproteobacteria bacterium]|nr:MAPEG family protein [Alphaproteobacteria bacterium]